jgi:hypothetical protein
MSEGGVIKVAAEKRIVRKETGEDWKEYLRGLARAEGIEDPTDEQLRQLDRKRKGKKVSNQDWVSPTDPDSRNHQDEGRAYASGLQG